MERVEEVKKELIGIIRRAMQVRHGPVTPPIAWESLQPFVRVLEDEESSLDDIMKMFEQCSQVVQKERSYRVHWVWRQITVYLEGRYGQIE